MRTQQRPLKVLLILFSILILRQSIAASGDQSQSFTLEGELYNSSTGSIPFLGEAQIQVRILDESKNCVLYAEAQTIDTTNSIGIFNIEIGSSVADPDGKRIGGSDSGNSMAQVFQNRLPINATGAGCGGPTYTPAVAGGDGRYLEISITPTASGLTDILSPDIFLGTVPSAITSETLQGLYPSNFAILKPTTTELTQANLEDIFSTTNFPILQALIAGSGASGTSSTTNSILNADSDNNSTGAVQLAINSSVKAEVKNDGDFAVDTSTLYVEAASNRVGIGSTTPSFDLSFGGDLDRVLGLERNSVANTAGNDITVQSGGATTGATDKIGGNLILASGVSTGTGSSNIYLQTATAATTGTADNAPTTKLTILGNGNVGIGTTTPTAALHLKAGTAAVNTAPLKFTSGTNLTTPESGAIEFDGTNLYYTTSTPTRMTLATTSGSSFTNTSSIANSGGNITLAPVATTGTVLINSGTTSINSTSGALTVTGGAGVSGDLFTGASINAGTTLSVGTNGFIPQLYGSSIASGTVKVDGTSHATKGYVLLNSAGGNVGIGTTTPANKLVVSGVDTNTTVDVINESSVTGHYPGINIKNFGTTGGYTGFPGLTLYNSGGTQAAPTTVPSGTAIGAFSMTGYDGTTYPASAPTSIIGFAAETFSATGHGAHLAFNTAGIGSITPAERMRITSAGNVGIGTTSPTAVLDVAGGGKFLGSIGLSGSTNPALTIFGGAAQGSLGVATSAGSFSDFSSVSDYVLRSITNNMILSVKNGGGSILFGTGTADTEKMRIANNGNVGIGTASPSSPLHVSSGTGTGLILERNSALNSNIQFKNTIGVMYAGLSPAADYGVGFNADLSTAHFTVKPNGLIGLGTTAPSRRLDVLAGAASSNPAAFRTSDYVISTTGSFLSFDFGAATGNTYSTLNAYQAGGASSNNLILQNVGGNVGIGNSNPTEKLHVTGNILASGTITASSDRRFKKNIATITKSLEKISKINGVQYDWKKPEDHSKGKQIGVIAQDVEKVFPEAVITDNKGFKAVAYMALIAPIINAMKELYQQFIQQDQKTMRKIASLEKSNEELKKENDELKQRMKLNEDRLNKIEKSLKLNHSP